MCFSLYYKSFSLTWNAHTMCMLYSWTSQYEFNYFPDQVRIANYIYYKAFFLLKLMGD